VIVWDGPDGDDDDFGAPAPELLPIVTS